MPEKDALIEVLGLMSAKECGSVVDLQSGKKRSFLFIYFNKSISVMCGRLPARRAPEFPDQRNWYILPRVATGTRIASFSKMDMILRWATDANDWSRENLVAMIQVLRRDCLEEDLDLMDPMLLLSVFGEYLPDNSHHRFQVWLDVLEEMEPAAGPHFDRIVSWLATKTNSSCVLNSECGPQLRIRELYIDKDRHSVSWEWLYDDHEPACELYRSFPDLLMYNEPETGWPLCSKGYYFTRYPRRVRKVVERERLVAARLERKAGSRRLPGGFEYNAFGIDDEWYTDRCVEHLQKECYGMCECCRRKHNWHGR